MPTCPEATGQRTHVCRTPATNTSQCRPYTRPEDDRSAAGSFNDNVIWIPMEYAKAGGSAMMTLQVLNIALFFGYE